MEENSRPIDPLVDYCNNQNYCKFEKPTPALAGEAYNRRLTGLHSKLWNKDDEGFHVAIL